jgi:hypothetical protein
MVSVPPYFGVPRLSHQFPIAALVVTVVVVGMFVLVVVNGEFAVVVVVVVFVDVDMEVEVDVDLAQDVKISEVTTRQVDTIQMAPLFMFPSFYF